MVMDDTTAHDVNAYLLLPAKCMAYGDSSPKFLFRLYIIGGKALFLLLFASIVLYPPLALKNSLNAVVR